MFWFRLFSRSFALGNYLYYLPLIQVSAWNLLYLRTCISLFILCFLIVIMCPKSSFIEAIPNSLESWENQFGLRIFLGDTVLNVEYIYIFKWTINFIAWKHTSTTHCLCSKIKYNTSQNQKQPTNQGKPTSETH